MTKVKILIVSQLHKEYTKIQIQKKKIIVLFRQPTRILLLKTLLYKLFVLVFNYLSVKNKNKCKSGKKEKNLVP